MHDPKLQYGAEDRIYRRDNGEPLPADEPMFTIRGKDEVGLRAIARYVEIMEQYPDSALAQEHAIAARHQYEVIRQWQKDHPDRAGMGCHSCADPTCREHLPDLPDL